MAPDELGSREATIAEADMAIVDTGDDPLAGIRLCWALRDLRDDLAVIALACCAQPFSQWHLQRLLAMPGGCGVVDLEATADELARSVEKQLRGRTSMHLQWPPGSPRLAGAADGDRDLRLVGLVSLGLSDQEIGWQLRLSPHTVHHRIERLRAELGVRNRVELAAWAGCHGIYGRAAAEMVKRSSPA
jgi:DNA-binding NarL/FixJ family response regulator